MYKNLIRFFVAIFVLVLFLTIPFEKVYAASTLLTSHQASFAFDGSITNRITSTTYTPGSCAYDVGKVNQSIYVSTYPSYSPTVISNASMGITSTDTVVTVAMWYNWSGVRDVSVPGFDTYYCATSTTRFGFTTTTDATDYYYCNNPFTSHTWTHVVMIYNYKNMAANKIYINGVEQTLQQLGTPSKTKQVWGTNFCFANSNQGFTGGDYYDDLQIWDRALTAAEVTNLYTAYSQSNPTMNNTADGVNGDVSLTWNMSDTTHDYTYNVYKRKEAGAYSAIQTGVSTKSYIDKACKDTTPPNAPTDISQSYTGTTIDTMNDHISFISPSDGGTNYTFYTEAVESVTGIKYASQTYTYLQTSGTKRYSLRYASDVTSFLSGLPQFDLQFVNSDPLSSGTNLCLWALDWAGNASPYTYFYANPPPFIIQSASTSTVDFGDVNPATSDYSINNAVTFDIEANFYTNISAKGLSNFIGTNPLNTIPIGALSMRLRDFTDLLPMGTTDTSLKDWSMESNAYLIADTTFDKYHVYDTQRNKYNYGLTKGSFVLDVNFKSNWDYIGDSYSATVQITIEPGTFDAGL